MASCYHRCQSIIYFLELKGSNPRASPTTCLCRANIWRSSSGGGQFQVINSRIEITFNDFFNNKLQTIKLSGSCSRCPGGQSNYIAIFSLSSSSSEYTCTYHWEGHHKRLGNIDPTSSSGVLFFQDLSVCWCDSSNSQSNRRTSLRQWMASTEWG